MSDFTDILTTSMCKLHPHGRCYSMSWNTGGMNETRNRINLISWVLNYVEMSV